MTPPKHSCLLTHLVGLVSNHLGVLPEKISPQASFAALGANELDRIELLIAIEKEYSTEIDMEASLSLQCVGDVAQYLKTQKG